MICSAQMVGRVFGYNQIMTLMVAVAAFYFFRGCMRLFFARAVPILSSPASTVLLDDEVYLKGREMKGTTDARLWLEQSEDFKEVTHTRNGKWHYVVLFCYRPFTGYDGSHASIVSPELNLWGLINASTTWCGRAVRVGITTRASNTPRFSRLPSVVTPVHDISRPT